MATHPATRHGDFMAPNGEVKAVEEIFKHDVARGVDASEV